MNPGQPFGSEASIESIKAIAAEVLEKSMLSESRETSWESSSTGAISKPSRSIQ
jgi:hypothetical protein